MEFELFKKAAFDMEFELFKKTAVYEKLVDSMKLASLFVLEDRGYQGLTFQDITQKLKGTLTVRAINNSLDLLLDKFKIEQAHGTHGDSPVIRYRLDRILLGEPLKASMCLGPEY